MKNAYLVKNKPRKTEDLFEDFSVNIEKVIEKLSPFFLKENPQKVGIFSSPDEEILETSKLIFNSLYSKFPTTSFYIPGGILENEPYKNHKGFSDVFPYFGLSGYKVKSEYLLFGGKNIRDKLEKNFPFFKNKFEEWGKEFDSVEDHYEEKKKRFMNKIDDELGDYSENLKFKETNPMNVINSFEDSFDTCILVTSEVTGKRFAGNLAKKIGLEKTYFNFNNPLDVIKFDFERKRFEEYSPSYSLSYSKN